MRLVLGISRPRKPLLGTFFSGVVESIAVNGFGDMELLTR